MEREKGLGKKGETETDILKYNGKITLKYFEKVRCTGLEQRQYKNDSG